MWHLTQLVSFATARRRRHGWAALMAVAALSSCGIGESQCSTDGDCSPTRTCVQGWFGGACQPRCSSNADCASDSFCSTTLTRPYCSKGCRDSSGCAETEYCNVGYCVVACRDAPHICDRGRSGSVCVGASPVVNGVADGNLEGVCRPSCQTDADCGSATFKQCLCGTCSAPCDPSCEPNRCRATDDCATPRCFPN